MHAWEEAERMAALAAQLAELKSVRRSGVTEHRLGDIDVKYRSDAELVSQIAALESEIAGLQGVPEAPRIIIVRSQKGW